MVWSRVNHPNILPLLGICSDFDRPNTPGLVSPYYSNGNIINYLKCRPGVDRLQLVSGTGSRFKIFCSHLFQVIHITSALSYLHSMGIIHGDMKAVCVSGKLYIYSFLIISRAIFSLTITARRVSRIMGSPAS